MKANYRVNMTPQFRVLSDDQIEEIFHASLEVLGRTGARIYGQEGLALLRDAGCHITQEDSGSQARGIVRIRPDW